MVSVFLFLQLQPSLSNRHSPRSGNCMVAGNSRKVERKWWESGLGWMGPEMLFEWLGEWRRGSVLTKREGVKRKRLIWTDLHWVGGGGSCFGKTFFFSFFFFPEERFPSIREMWHNPSKTASCMLHLIVKPHRSRIDKVRKWRAKTKKQTKNGVNKGEGTKKGTGVLVGSAI